MCFWPVKALPARRPGRLAPTPTASPGGEEPAERPAEGAGDAVQERVDDEAARPEPHRRPERDGIGLPVEGHRVAEVAVDAEKVGRGRGQQDHDLGDDRHVHGEPGRLREPPAQPRPQEHARQERGEERQGDDAQDARARRVRHARTPCP